MNLREEIMSPVFTKYHIEGLGFDAVIHKFTAPDTGDPHDHPFDFHTQILRGSYVEEVYSISDKRKFAWTKETIVRQKGSCRLVKANTIHKIVDLPYGACYSLITPYKKIKEPCFWKFERGEIYFRIWNENTFKLYSYV